MPRDRPCRVPEKLKKDVYTLEKLEELRDELKVRTRLKMAESTERYLRPCFMFRSSLIFPYGWWSLLGTRVEITLFTRVEIAFNPEKQKVI